MLQMCNKELTVFSAGALPEFQAVQGSTAHLPCQVPPRPPSSGIKCIFWYKDDEVMSVYTVDARDSGKHSLHVPSERLRSRAQFDPSPWPPVLRLVAVKETDAGVYYCRVDYRWDRTYMYTVVLKVIGKSMPCCKFDLKTYLFDNCQFFIDLIHLITGNCNSF